MMHTLVLGLGNLLLADEGVGVHVSRRLAERVRSNEVSVLDVGTAILDALPQIEEAGRVIVIDACRGGSKPGTIYALDIQECVDRPFLGSLHGFDLKRVLALTGRTSLPPVTVIGIEPARIAWALELSEEVEAVVPGVVDMLEQQLGGRPGPGDRCRSDRSS